MNRAALKTIKKVPHFKTVLVTGAASYLGASLIETLLKQGYRVVGLDAETREPSGYLKLFSGNPRFYFISANLAQDLPANIASVDYIFHLESALLPRKELSKNSLEQFLGPLDSTRHLLEFAYRAKATLLVATPIKNQTIVEKLALEYYQRTDLDVRLTRLPYCYGPHFQREKPTHLLAQFIRAAQKGAVLKVKGTGLAKEYYLHIDDLTAGLTKAMVTPHTSGEIFSLCESAGTTALELAYIVKGAGLTLLEVEFSPDETETYQEDPAIDTENLKKLSWEPQISLKEGIKPLLWQKPPTPSPLKPVPVFAPQFKKPSPTLPKINLPAVKLPRLPKPAFRKPGAALTLALPILLPLLYLVTNLALGGYDLKRTIKLCQKAQFGECGEVALTADRHLEKVSSFTARLNLLPPKIKPWLLAGQYGTEAVFYEAQGLEILKQSLKAATPYSPTKPPSQSELITASADFSKGLERLMLFYSEAKYLETAKIPGKLRPYFEKLLDNQDKIVTTLGTLLNISKEMPELLGFVAPQNYLILLQNNQELRAGGGFIGSYALVTVDHGKITNFKTDDIYNIDGILEEKGAGLTAPKEFTQYLGLENIYLRDANFSAGFPENARRAIDLYQKATGSEITGVMAINLSALAQLLEKLGPVETDKYGLIDGNNVLEKAVFFAEKNYFSGAQNKKSFLAALGGSLIEKVISHPDESLVKIAPLIYESLNEKDIQIYSLNSNLEQTLAQSGWDGKVSPTAGSDFLMIVEENLGANKANYTLERSIKYEITETDRQGSLRAKLTISYLNTAKTAIWPLGDYDVFATILKNGPPQTFFTTIEPQENYVKTLSWDLPPEINAASYRLAVLKQPGMANTAFSFFYHPIMGGQSRSFEGYLTNDLEFDINSGALWN